ncbi:DUF7933 domain-containing protein [Wenzhouxiangella marina]|uniref:DUF7933 domain-containing protein n=1 Tax=Wenzhouxiangella marina TaxID=1579979 RepID=UPI0006736055|nr:choice-of-anchor D domain-containing protein [Wenzhouxiangella marina]MBB6085686.1 hypothetical protein [Wenzhouxiangella marina]
MLAVVLFSVALMAAASGVQAQPTFDLTHVPDEIGPGGSNLLVFDIQNGSGAPATDLAFTTILPAGATLAVPAAPMTDCVGGVVTAPDGGSTISFSGGSLAGFESCQISVQVKADLPGFYTTTSGDLTSSQGNSGPATDEFSVEADRPGFSKSFSPVTAPFGGRSTLSFFIDNSLNAQQSFSLRFTDELPLGMIIADPPNVANSCGGGSIVAMAGSDVLSYAPAFPGDASVAAGGVCSISVDVVSSINLGGFGPVINTSDELTSITVGPVDTSGFATAALEPVVSGNVILIQEFLADPVLPGETVDVRFTVQNLDRDHALSGGSFDFDLDLMLAGLSAVGLPASDVCGAGSSLDGGAVLSLNGANLPPEGLCFFTVTLQVPAGAATGAYPAVTSALTGTIDGAPVASEAPRDILFISESPRLGKVFLNDPVGAGGTVSMEFTLSNPSATEAASAIAFSDNLSAFFDGAVVTALPAAGFCGPGSFAFANLVSGSLFLNVIEASLAPGASCTFVVDLLMPVSSNTRSATNITSPLTATVAGVTNFGPVATADLTVIGGPRLAKQFSADVVQPGATVNLDFTISLEEGAPAQATGITFTDDLDAMLTGLVAIGLPSNDVCGTGSSLSGTSVLTLSGGTLQPGQSCSFSVTLQVPASALPGEYSNLTSQASGIISGLTVIGPAASDRFLVGGLGFDLEFIDDPVLAGGTLTARYTIDNSSASDASGLFFTHNLNASLAGLVPAGALPTEPCGAGSALSGTGFLIFTGGNLPAGTDCVFDIPLAVPAGAGDGQYGSVTSNLTGTLGGSPITLPPANDQFLLSSSLLFLQHDYTNDPAMPGGAVTLEFTLSNLDASNGASALSFTHDLNAIFPGLSAVALPAPDVCGPGSSINGVGLLTLSGGSLPPGGSCTFPVDVVIPAGMPAGSYPSQTSGVTGTITGLPVTGPASSAELGIQSFGFSKSFLTNPLDIGAGPATSTLQFQIVNNGSQTATGLAFSDDLDAMLSGLVATNLPLGDVCGAGSSLSGTSVISLSGASLPPGGSCSFSAEVLTPASALGGTYTNTSSDLFQAGLPVAGPAVADLTLVGAAVLVIDPSLIDFGPQRLGTTSAALSASIENQGNDVLSVVSIDGPAAPFAAAGGDCPAAPFDLAPGASCFLAYDFSPLALGPSSLALAVTSNAATVDDTLVLQGVGIEPALTITPAAIDFGDQLINTSSPALSASLSNSGTATLLITDLSAPAGDFAVVTSDCGTLPITLPVGSSCSIDYRFSPTATGPALSTINVTSDAPSSVDSFDLSGNGIQGALALSSTLIDFPDTNLLAGPSLIDLTLSNAGDGLLTISAISDPLAPFTVLTGARGGADCGPVPIALVPGGSCNLHVQFAPPTLGDFTSSFELASDSPSSPDVVTLNGRGVQALLTLGSNALLFPDTAVGATASQNLALQNDGNIDLNVSLNDDPGAPFTVLPGNCTGDPILLTPTASCELEVQFAPQAPGDFTASFLVDSDSGEAAPSVDLSGRGLQGILSLDASDLDFPVTALGETSLLQVTLSNTGNLLLTVSDLIGPSAPFAIESSTCGSLPFPLDAAASCSLTISFAPISHGVFNDVIEVQHDGLGSPTFIGLSGSLQTLPVPVLDRLGLGLLILLLALPGALMLRRLD